MFATKRPTKKHQNKKQAQNYSQNIAHPHIFKLDKHPQKQIHKIASVRTIQPLRGTMEGDRKLPVYNQYPNKISKPQRKVSYLSQEGNPEQLSDIDDKPLLSNLKLSSQSITKNFYTSIEKQLANILLIVKRQSQQAHKQVRKIKEQIHQQKARKLQMMNRVLSERGTQTFDSSNMVNEMKNHTRAREFTFQGVNDSISKIDSQIQSNQKKGLNYLTKELTKLQLAKIFKIQSFQEEDNTVLQQEERIKWNKQLIKLLLSKQ